MSKQQYETQCTSGADLATLGAMMGGLTPPQPPSRTYDAMEVKQQQLAIKQQQMQNELMRLQLQELQRSQALRQNGQR